MRIIIALGLLMALAFPQATLAADDSEWTFTVAPYAWFAGINGDVTVKGRVVDVDTSFSDLFDSLDFGFLGYLEAQRGRWGVFADLNYLDFSTDREATKSGAAINAELELTQWIVEFGGLYNFFKREIGGAGSERWFFADAYLGGRYWDVDSDLDVELATLGGPVQAEFSQDASWVDPMVGARLQVDLPRRFLVHLRGDIGGFGIGEASHFTWSAMGLLGYRLADWATLLAGYRALSVNREDDFETDVTMRGPIAGVAFTF